MAARYGCFEVQAICKSCGQPLPVNGAMRTCVCTECFATTTLPEDHVPGFLNDFEAEYPGLEEKQGKGGQMMGGGQRYSYAYYRLDPRCDRCKTPLPEAPVETEGHVSCPQCGERYHVHPAPAWLRDQVPSAVQVISPEREEAAAGQPLAVDQKKPQPVLMTCPGCGGGLTITAETERTCTCQFCQNQIFLPDELWKRLHPVKVKRAWFVRFEGPSMKELDAERRRRDVAEQQAEIARRGPVKAIAGKLKQKYGPITILLIVVGALICAVGVVLPLISMMVLRREMWWLTMPALVAGIVLIAISTVAPSMLGARSGRLRACKKAMIEIGHRLGLTIHGEHESSYIGTASGKVEGREVTIDPSGDEAIEVDMNEGWSFFLQTDARYAEAPEGLWRFTTGEPRVDGFFPIRYAKPRVARRLEKSPDSVAPLVWYLERWGSRIVKLEVAGDVEVHIHPGGADSDDTKYLLPEDIEPLLFDTIALAKALDKVVRGDKPEMPAHHRS